MFCSFEVWFLSCVRSLTADPEERRSMFFYLIFLLRSVSAATCYSSWETGKATRLREKYIDNTAKHTKTAFVLHTQTH